MAGIRVWKKENTETIAEKAAERTIKSGISYSHKMEIPFSDAEGGCPTIKTNLSFLPSSPKIHTVKNPSQCELSSGMPLLSTIAGMGASGQG